MRDDAELSASTGSAMVDKQERTAVLVAGMHRSGTSAHAHDIALVISDMGGGGAQRVLTNLINIWSEQGLRICLITSLGEEFDRYALPANITRLALRCSTRSGAKLDHLSTSGETMLQPVKPYIPKRSAIDRIRTAIQDVYTLRMALTKANSPIVLAFLTSPNVKTIMASVGLDARVVVSERIDLEKQPRNWPWHVLRRWLYRYADAVTANSHSALKSMESYVPKSKLFFVPNPVSFPSAPDAGSRREKIVLNVGRLTRQKAQDVLLKAFARVAAEMPEWRLAIVGYGQRKDELQALASSLRLSGRVEWVEWTTDIERYYERAGIFVLPSRFEGTPNALLEAMSFGLPSVVTDSSPGPLEHIADGKNGLVVPADDEKRLAEALLRLTSSQELRDRLGASARKTIKALNNDDIRDAWSAVLGLPEGERYPLRPRPEPTGKAGTLQRPAAGSGGGL